MAENGIYSGDVLTAYFKQLFWLRYLDAAIHQMCIIKR